METEVHTSDAARSVQAPAAHIPRLRDAVTS
jgi:hypothetical protein